VLQLRSRPGDGKYAKVPVPHDDRMRRQVGDCPEGQLLLAHSVWPVRWSPMRTQRETGLNVLQHYEPDDRPMRISVLITRRRIRLQQTGCMRQRQR
jgi:hypothetical protein